MAIARAARTIALTALLVGALSLPGSAYAALDIHHASTAVTEVGGGDGVISQGDALDVTETVSSSEPVAAVTGLNGVLSTSTPGVTIPEASAAFPALGFGLTAANTTPYRVQVGSGVDCGQNMRFSLGLSADQGTATVPFVIGTGSAAAPVDLASVDVPRAITDTGVTNSSLPVASSARVKNIAVHIGKITHSYVGDLKITLIAPDGTSVVLVDQRGGSGANFVNTTFTVDQGSPIAGASAPFTGTYKAEGGLGAMIGHLEQGTWKLRVNDQAPGNTGTIVSWGLTLSDASCVAQPVASFTATPNPVAPGDTVQFDASGSHDPAGKITDYDWDLDGNGTFETPGGSTPPTMSKAFPTRGAYVVGLRVTDDVGLESTYQRTVNVSLPPTAVLTSSSPAPKTFEAITLDASGSTDPEGPIAGYEFDLDGDSIFEVNSGAVSHVTTSFSTPGLHTVAVRVTDEDGATATAALDVTAINRPPTAQLVNPGLRVVGSPLTLSAAGSTDPDGTITDYDWDFDGDGEYDANTGVPTAPPHTFSSGMVTVRLRVTDSESAQATTSVTFKVTDPPLADVTAAPLPARPGQTVSFSAAGSSDPDGTTLTFRWDLDANGSFETDTGSVATTSRAYPVVGSYPVKVEVKDADGVTTVATKTVDVVNLLPSPSLVVSSGEAVTGAPVSFDASGSSDPDGTVTRYQWDLDGNGSYELDTGTVPTASRTYANAGTISVRLRVTDNDGATASTTTPVVVTTPAPGGVGTGGTGGTGGNGGTGGTGGNGSSGGTGSQPLGDFSAGLRGASIQAMKLAARKGLTMTCTSDRAMRCTLTATIDSRTAVKLRLARKPKAATVGSAVVDVAAGGDGRFVLKLSTKARKALQRAKRVRLVVKGTAVDADGHVVKLTRVVLLRR